MFSKEQAIQIGSEFVVTEFGRCGRVLRTGLTSEYMKSMGEELTGDDEWMVNIEVPPGPDGRDLYKDGVTVLVNCESGEARLLMLL